MPRFRNACITWNNYPENGVERLTAFYTAHCSFMVYGKEIAKTTGTPHLQIYLEFTGRPTLKMLAKAFDNSHVEARKGIAKSAAGYCMKGENDPGEKYELLYEIGGDITWDGEMIGELSQHGKRNDIHAVVADIEDGATVSEVARDHPITFIRMHKGIDRLRQELMPSRRLQELPEVIVLWGPTGTGKTERAEDFYWPDDDAFIWKPQMGTWFDGYDGQKKVILDEFRGQLPFATLLTLLDKYSCRMPVKGGFVQIQADKFIITSPLPPEKWYKLDCEYDRYEQLTRRIKTVISTGGGPVLPPATCGTPLPVTFSETAPSHCED